MLVKNTFMCCTSIGDYYICKVLDLGENVDQSCKFYKSLGFLNNSSWMKLRDN